ncbi:MAG: pirin family protein [Pseudomonadota bacterium]
MIKVYPYEQLGRANHGWLDARHHFSFAGYYNPERMGFGTLRVINDDIIKAGRGFDTHPHKNMEIITYVRKGAISHQDSNGNKGKTKAGDVQVMSAGTGVYHSEFNHESTDTNIFQIWIEPAENDVEPAWDSHEFPQRASTDALELLVSGDGSAPLQIHADAFIYAGYMKSGSQIHHPVKRQAYVLVSEGEVMINDFSAKTGDGVEVTDLTAITLSAVTDSRFLVLDVPSVH